MNGFTTLRIPSAKYLNIRWSPRRLPFENAAAGLSSPLNPLYARVRDEVKNSSVPDHLQWKVVTNMSSRELPKACQRKRLKRRWTQAFIQALKAKGLDQLGRPLGAEDGVGGIKGTMEMHIWTGKGLDSPFTELVAHGKGTLLAIEKSLKMADGQSRGPLFEKTLKTTEGQKMAGEDLTRTGMSYQPIQMYEKQVPVRTAWY